MWFRTHIYFLYWSICLRHLYSCFVFLLVVPTFTGSFKNLNLNWTADILSGASSIEKIMFFMNLNQRLTFILHTNKQKIIKSSSLQKKLACINCLLREKEVMWMFPYAYLQLDDLLLNLLSNNKDVILHVALLDELMHFLKFKLLIPKKMDI